MFDLKKFLQGAVAQINPWDNGANYNSVVNQPAQPPQPATTARPQQRAAVSTPGQTSQPTQRQRPVKQAQAPVFDTAKIFQDINNAATGAKDFVGKTAGDIGRSIAEPYNYIGKGIAEVANEATGNAQRERDMQAASDKQDLDLIKAFGERIKVAQSPEEAQRLRDGLTKIVGVGDSQTQNFQNRQQEIINSTDPIRGAASIASIGTDVATAGIGTAGVKGVKAALQAGGKMGAAKELAKQAGVTAATAAPSGALAPVVSEGGNAKAEDILKGAATAAAIGGAIPLGAAAVKPVTTKLVSGARQAAPVVADGVRAANRAVEQINPAIKELDNTLAQYQRAFDVETNPTRRAQINMGIADLNTQRRSLSQGGYIKVPGGASDDLVRKVFKSGTDENALYHGTSPENAVSILRDGKINPNQSDIEPAVSFARNRNAGFKLGYFGQPVRLVADNDALTNSVGKTKAYVDGELTPSKGPGFEAEQRVVNKSVPVDTLRRIEVDGDLLSKQEIQEIRDLASKKGITVVDTKNVNEMRKVLDKSQDLPIVGPNLNRAANDTNALFRTQDTLPQTPPQQNVSTQMPQVPSPANTRGQISTGLLSGNRSGNSYVDNTIPAPNSQGRQSRFASQTAPNSGNLSDELAQRVRQSAPDYDPVTNQGSLEASIGNLREKGVDSSADDVISRLDNKGSASNPQTVSDSLATATALDLRGDEASLRKASEIYDKLSSRLTEAGQTVQAAKLINRRSGQGLLFDAQRQLKNAGVDLTPQTRKELSQYAQRFDNIDSKLTGQARDEAKSKVVAEMQKSVNKLIPTEMVDKVVGTWKAGLLTGIRTTTGGALSNALFRGLREVSRPGASAIDMALSAITGKRSVALTNKGAWQGTSEGLKKGVESLKTGIDERSFSADGKYIDREINFGDSPAGKAMNTYVNGVFRVMGAADRPFYYSQFRNSIAEAATVEAKNLGLKGKAFDDYVLNGIKNPSTDAAQYATDIAEKAVLANDTFLSSAANKLKQAADTLDNRAAKIAAKGTLGVLLPFTKVPSAFLSRVIDFTPVGAIKEVAEQAGNGKINQAKLAQALSEAGTGTGIIYLGATLANNDLLSGNYPNDRQEQARWKAEGITPNSVRIGDTWYSLNYAGPLGSLMNVGKAVTDSLKEGNPPTSAISAGLGQLASGTLEQSFLSGVSGALDAVQDPERYAKNFVQSQAGSVVPTLLNDIGNATDETQRQVNTPVDAIKGRIPGVRTTLNEKTDSFGNVLDQANPNVAGRLVDPFRPSKSRETGLTQELGRLDKAGETIYPTTDKTIKAGGETVKLTPDQQKQYNDTIGQRTQSEWNTAIATPEYQSATDAEKKAMLGKIQTTITAEEKKNMLTTLGKGELADKVKVTSSKKATQDKYNSDNAAEYNDLKAKYDEKVKKGELSPTQKIKAETSLNKAKVGADFSKSTRDYYGLSKAQLNQLVSTDPDGNRILEDVLKYGDRLVEAGINSYNKFRDKKGAVSLAKATKKASGGRKGGTKVAKGKATKAAKGSSFNFGSLMASTDKLASANQSAIRNLVKGKTIKRKELKA